MFEQLVCKSLILEKQQMVIPALGLMEATYQMKMPCVQIFHRKLYNLRAVCHLRKWWVTLVIWPLLLKTYFKYRLESVSAMRPLNVIFPALCFQSSSIYSQIDILFKELGRSTNQISLGNVLLFWNNACLVVRYRWCTNSCQVCFGIYKVKVTGCVCVRVCFLTFFSLEEG